LFWEEVGGMGKDARQRISDTLEPLAAAHGLELWQVELAGAHHQPVVRVFLDREGGVTCDDLTDANDWIAEALEELGIPSGPYVLEVSSPGIERALRGPADYARYTGSKAEVKLTAAQDGRKTFTGVIAETGEDAVVLDTGAATVRLPYNRIAKARLRVDFAFDEKESGHEL
jgi:ribosome maturation factor RimP